MNEQFQTLTTAAIQSACRFLAAGQEPDGFWRDYALPPGPSSEWVTAFVGYALAGTGPAHAESINRGLSAVRSSRRPSGWGYNPRVATDADTTSWVVRWFLRTRTALPVEPVPCLEGYVSPEGGARTFVCGPRYGRWTIEHADVTAVLGLAMKEAGAGDSTLGRIRRWALDQRNSDGLWTSFWWSFDAYAAARMLELLAGTGGIPADVAEAARAYLETKTDSSTPMETANLLMMASRVGVSPEAWLSPLLDSQRSGGGWPPSRVLKVPDQKTASGNDEVFEDCNGLMSTAMALMALTDFLGNGHDPA